MTDIKINVELSTSSIEQAIKTLNNIRLNITSINKEFSYESMKWIQKRANEYLEQKVRFPGSANIKEDWHINPTINQKNLIGYELRNDNDVVAYVEFGTGIVGSRNPHKIANEKGYKYDINNRGDKGWTFYNEEIGLYLEGFRGYEGKSFLYQAFWDYYYHKVWKNMYIRLYDRYMKSLSSK